MYVFPIAFGGENMISTSLSLINGGFEDGYRKLYDPTTGEKPHHKAWVYEVDITGGPITKRYTVERGEIHNPIGWWSWYAHQRNNNPVPWDSNNTIGWAEPETRVSEPEHNRHRSGEHAGYLFTWRRIHEGGLFQQITVQSGARLRFSAYTHAWIGDDAHPPTWSLPGYGALAWQVGTPNLNDDQRSVRQYVGIDPTGGINPYADTVIWGDGWHIFNEYRNTPLTVETTAMGDTVTVFLKSSTLWPVVHNDIAWDDCSIEVIDTPEPPTECRGKPRVQYDRTYFLIHPNESDAMRKAFIDAQHELDTNWTSGPSADDAGIGDLDNRTVIALNPALWENSLQDFYLTYYPGVVYKEIFVINPEDLYGELYRLIHGEPEELVFTYPTTYMPPTITSPFGPRGDGFHYGVDFRSSWKVWKTELLAAIDGTVVLTGVEKGKEYFGTQVQIETKYQGKTVLVRYAHLVSEEEGGIYVKVGDKVVRGQKIGRPDNTGISTADHLHFDVRINGSYINPTNMIDYPEDPNPPTPPEPSGPWQNKPRISLHNQGGLPQVLREFLRNVKPAVWKTFDTGQIRDVWEESPDTFVVYRHHLGDDHVWLNEKTPQEYVDRFKNTLLTFKDIPQVQRGLLAAESINEVMAGSDIPRAVAWDVEFIRVMKKDLPFVRPLVATIPVGNVEYSDLEHLNPLIDASKDMWAVWGYHNYWPAYEGKSYLVEDWEYYSGRFERIHTHALNRGVNLLWVFGETGAITRLPGGHMPPEEGWKHPRCMNNNWNEYLKDIVKMDDLLYNHKYRKSIIGATLFTIGNVGWEWFQLSDDQIRQLAQQIM